jgi:glycosyltransferase involved in cell wall biosynthesis
MDRKVFLRGSAVAERMVDHGTRFGELHIIVFALENLGLQPIQLSQNVWVYPTSSKDRISYLADAMDIGVGILSSIYFGQSVIITQDPFETALIGLRLKWRFKVPLQIQIHTDLFSSYFYNLSWLNFFRVGLARFLLPRADGIRTVSRKIKSDVIERFKKINPNYVANLPVFVDIEKIQDTPVGANVRIKYKQWGQVVLVVSRLQPEKNVQLSIKVFAEALKHYSNTGLVIVGEGPQEFKLKNLVKSLGLEKNVAFEGFRQDVVSYMKTATVFLNTSVFEGYGMTLVEAAASGAVILTSSVGVAPEILRDGQNGMICPVNDLNCFKNKLINLLGDQQMRDVFGRNIAYEVKNSISSKEQYLDEYAKALEALSEEAKNKPKKKKFANWKFWQTLKK